MSLVPTVIMVVAMIDVDDLALGCGMKVHRLSRSHVTHLATFDVTPSMLWRANVLPTMVVVRTVIIVVAMMRRDGNSYHAATRPICGIGRH